mgnify:CR=1 FL=1
MYATAVRLLAPQLASKHPYWLVSGYVNPQSDPQASRASREPFGESGRDPRLRRRGAGREGEMEVADSLGTITLKIEFSNESKKERATGRQEREERPGC